MAWIDVTIFDWRVAKFLRSGLVDVYHAFLYTVASYLGNDAPSPPRLTTDFARVRQEAKPSQERPVRRIVSVD